MPNDRWPGRRIRGTGPSGLVSNYSEAETFRHMQPLLALFAPDDVRAITALTEAEKTVRRASADPGAFTERGGNYEEPLYAWQARAVLVALRSLPVVERMEAMGMEKVAR